MWKGMRKKSEKRQVERTDKQTKKTFRSPSETGRGLKIRGTEKGVHIQIKGGNNFF